MRKIEQAMNQAIHSKTKWTSGNTCTAVTPEGAVRVFLHGHNIATVNPDGTKEVNLTTLRNWPTTTTKSRLRALGFNVSTKAGATLLDGEEI